MKKWRLGITRSPENWAKMSQGYSAGIVTVVLGWGANIFPHVMHSEAA